MNGRQRTGETITGSRIWPRVRRLVLAAGATAVLVSVAGCAPAAPARAVTPRPTVTMGAGTVTPSARGQQAADAPVTSPSARPIAVPATPASTARSLLATLPVKGRAAMTGYARELFGEPWSDVDGNGCDTRDDVLTRDVQDRRYEAGSRCVVESGRLPDPYTGRVLPFVRGYGDLVDIDHVVALGNAWATGAFGWDATKRLTFANDPNNLLAVDSSSNRQKGDGDAATWLPSNKAFRCDYVARQVSVKAAYGLWVTPPERNAIARILTACPGQSRQPLTATPTLPTQSAQSAQSAQPAAAAAAASAAGVFFANCDAARAAGAAPVRRGDPGYSRRLDRDGDGTGCE